MDTIYLALTFLCFGRHEAMYLAYKIIEHGRKWFNKSPVWKHWFSGQIYGYNQILSAIEYNQILSLSSLGKNGNEVEKENIRHNCKKFIVENLTYSPVFFISFWRKSNQDSRLFVRR